MAALTNVRGLPNQQGYTFDLKLKNDPSNPEINALSIIIKDISPGNYVKNIRIVMPGGVCTNTSDGEKISFIRADSSAD